MENNLFRKEAMEEITSPDSLDQIIKITNRKTHLVILGMVLLIFSGALWGYFGSIPIISLGSGIIMPEGGVHYILPQKDGIIKSMNAEVGHYLHKDEVVGTLTNTDELGNEILLTIKAHVDGRVSEVRVLPGDTVSSHEKILSVVGTVENQEILTSIVFVPIETGKSLTAGMLVQVDPTNVNKEEYGYIKGVVQKVSVYPVSQQRMLELLGVESLVSKFSEGKAVLEVEVDLLLSTSTVSGYQWSTPEGPPFKIYEGTTCSASFIVETKKPLQLIMPQLK